MKLHSTISGKGSPIIILHGFLGMSDNWKTISKDFSEAGFEVHLVDQRNHGRSPHSEEFDYLSMAKDVKEYIDEHNLKEVILLGHSMGGKTAMTTACLFPHVVYKLVVVDIAPKYYPPHHQRILEGLQAVDRADLSSRGEAEDLLAQYVHEADVRLFLLKNLYWRSKGKLALRMNLDVLVAKIENIGEALPNNYVYKGPTLFIKGERSDYILPQEDEREIHRHFPSSEIKSIQNSGHWVHAENKDDFFTTVLDFLQES